MREILFRGMDVLGKWHCGLLAESAGFPGQVCEGVYISNSVGSPFAYIVRPETVGQYIGLRDKHNVRIFEDDRLHWVGEYHAKSGAIRDRMNPGAMVEIDTVLPVEFADNKGFQMYERGIGHYEIFSYCVEVVGNSHEKRWFETC